VHNMITRPKTSRTEKATEHSSVARKHLGWKGQPSLPDERMGLAETVVSRKDRCNVVWAESSSAVYGVLEVLAHLGNAPRLYQPPKIHHAREPARI